MKKIDESRDRTEGLDGIAEIRDESDRTGLRIVIELKKDIPGPGYFKLSYLKQRIYKLPYNFNMIAIHNQTTDHDDIYRCF